MRAYLILIFALPFTVAFSQKNINPERVKQLKALPLSGKSALIAYNYNSTYDFVVSGEQCKVPLTETVNIISLKGNIDYVRNVYYNDNVSTQDVDVRMANGRALKSTHACGNYEIDDIFYSDAKVCVYKFNFFNEGTEATFKAKSTYDDPRYLTKVFFHDELPVESREIVFNVSKNVNVDLVEKNFEGFDITKTKTETANGIIYKYTVKNLKAFISESNSLGFLYHYPHILVVTKDYTTSSGKKTVLASIGDLYKWYSDLVNQVQNDKTAFEEEVKRLTATAKTPEEKIKAIYYWVQDNIKYIAFEDGIAGFKPDAAQNVYTNRYGDCKGMANLTKQMLKTAGFDARLTWIGTNRIPYNYTVPTLAVDNHMICTVYANGKQYILDPTEKYIALGKHGERIQGKEMLIENGKEYVLSKVPVSDPASNLISRTETLSLEGDILKGKGELQLEGEAKTQILYYSNYVKAEDKRKILDNLVISDHANTDKIEVLNEPPADREKPLHLQYNYSLTNKVSRFGKDVYIDLEWAKAFGDLKLEDDRQSDYYFNRKVKQKTVKKLKVPVGYKVTHLPASLKKAHKEFTFDISFKQVGNEIHYSNEVTITDGLVRKANFKTWNEIIQQLKDVYSDQIVITQSK
ncbi:MAG TPA: transglutaminase domain-containing protein [Chryseosolibacter sp.]|nr:transglutaminase domain-containing protein [Chryseosolibacter sp.]